MDDIDLTTLEEVFKDVDPDFDKRNPGPSFLTDIVEDETEIVLGRKKPLPKKKWQGTEVVCKEPKESVIHKGDTDSSDDEDNKYFENRNFNECGRDVKEIMRSSGGITAHLNSQPQINKKKWKNDVTESTKFEVKTLSNGCLAEGANDVLRDPIFGMRIINPVVSSAVMKERMVGRLAMSTLKIKNFLAGKEAKDVDWVTGGVITAKSIRTSQKGNQYCIWNLTDLHGDIKTICVFLFGTAYKDFWKTVIGTVVGILNPGVMETKESRMEATLRVENSQKIMVFGSAKDFGLCKSKKKNGEKCTAVVNTSSCEYCVYHVKKEYQTASRRTELQSSCAGRGLNSLRNKVLGKSEVFYAGKSFTSVPGKKTTKHVEKDSSRLKQLMITQQLPRTTTKDRDTLSKLSEKPQSCVVQDKPLMPASPIATTPKESFIDLGAPISRKQRYSAKLNALKYVKQNGPLTTAADSTKRRVAKTPEQIAALKRKLENNETTENKKPKLEEPQQPQDLLREKRMRCGITDEFLKLMNSKAQDVELLKEAEAEEQEKYFNKLEIREKMEEKMLSTFKMECKVVRCLKCNYKSFSASDLCKQEKHPLKVVNGMKRFWKCGDCSNRTVCLELVPLHACKVCGSSKWVKTSMMREKGGANLTRDPLSLRGFEEAFVGAHIKNANLNLLVPEES